MRKYIISFLLLSGCSAYTLPPPTPTPDDIQKIATTIKYTSTTPLEDYVYGITLAKRNCVGWFSTQIASSSRNSALSSELGTLGTVAGTVAVLSGPAGGAAAATMGFGVATLNNMQNNALAGVDPVVTFGLVDKQQQAWLAAAIIPTTKELAYMFVEDFSEKCQLPNMRMAINDAVRTAPVRSISTSNAMAFGFVPETRRLNMPPTIIVGSER